MNDIKEYAKYLIEKYKSINDKWEDSGLYYDLLQFYETGRIIDLISKNDKIKTKIDMFNIFRNDIIKFSNDFKVNIEIDTFEDFQLSITSPEVYSINKKSKKYNL